MPIVRRGPNPVSGSRSPVSSLRYFSHLKFIEIFLSPDDQTIKLASGTTTINGSLEDGAMRDICRYRLTADRSGLEFIVSNDGTDWLAADSNENSETGTRAIPV